MNLLLTGAFRYTEKQKQELAALGYNVTFMQQEAESLPIAASEVDAVVCNGLFLHHDIDDFTRLGLIQLTSAGLDRVPVAKIRERGIKLLNARGVYSTPMAEWAVMRVLEHYKNVAHFAEAQTNCEWNKCSTLREICGTNVTVVGAGNVGQEVAKRFQAFGAKTTGFDIHTSETPHFDEMKLISSIAEHIGEYDVVVVTAPLTDETYHLISGDLLRKMKHEAMIVNIARGALVDEQALISVLTERKDICAALDVFETEPLPAESPLWKMENVMVSPHNSFVGDGNNGRMYSVMYNNLKEYVK